MENGEVNNGSAWFLAFLWVNEGNMKVITEPAVEKAAEGFD